MARCSTRDCSRDSSRSKPANAAPDSKKAIWNDCRPTSLTSPKPGRIFRPPGWGNVSDQPNGQAVPLIVPFADDAQDYSHTFADECDAAYELASEAGSEPIMAIWREPSKRQLNWR